MDSSGDEKRAELRRRLGDLSWRVTQEAATERAFSGRFWDFFEAGRYHCIVCGKELFRSQHKFDAHCGWPSFSEVAEQGRIETREDLSHGMHRVEVRCANCHAHLGHVFADGPEPQGLRYCINSAALDFEPDTGVADPHLPRSPP